MTCRRAAMLRSRSLDDNSQKCFGVVGPTSPLGPVAFGRIINRCDLMPSEDGQSLNLRPAETAVLRASV
jgi:hypothetical protein